MSPKTPRPPCRRGHSAGIRTPRRGWSAFRRQIAEGGQVAGFERSLADCRSRGGSQLAGSFQFLQRVQNGRRELTCPIRKPTIAPGSAEPIRSAKMVRARNCRERPYAAERVAHTKIQRPIRKNPPGGELPGWTIRANRESALRGCRRRRADAASAPAVGTLTRPRHSGQLKAWPAIAGSAQSPLPQCGHSKRIMAESIYVNRPLHATRRRIRQAY